jgi:RNA polymerase sigma factor (TIGR02999 family)
MSDATRILQAIEQGDQQAAEQLLPLVYDELRKLAAARLAAEKPGHTLSATSLVHEAYLRLVGNGEGLKWQSRGHFFAAAAEAMRRLLIEAARRKQADKRGGDYERLDFSRVHLAVERSPDQLLDLNDALDKLATDDAAAAETAKLRLFAGLTVEEAAESLGVSRRPANRQWTYARAFLAVELQD